MQKSGTWQIKQLKAVIKKVYDTSVKSREMMNVLEYRISMANHTELFWLFFVLAVYCTISGRVQYSHWYGNALTTEDMTVRTTPRMNNLTYLYKRKENIKQETGRRQRRNTCKEQSWNERRAKIIQKYEKKYLKANDTAYKEKKGEEHREGRTRRKGRPLQKAFPLISFSSVALKAQESNRSKQIPVPKCPRGP